MSCNAVPGYLMDKREFLKLLLLGGTGVLLPGARAKGTGP